MATDRISLGLLALRVFVGVAFWFHGFGKLELLTAFAAEFQIPLPLAGAAAYTQMIGALLLIAGLCTCRSAGLGFDDGSCDDTAHRTGERSSIPAVTVGKHPPSI